MEKKEVEEDLFPFETVREIQKEMMDDVKKVVEEGKHLVVHAPTGLGKTAAALSPALSYALKNNKTVLFLTSRHTQHMIAIETLGLIKKKFNTDIIVADFIGKKWMCLQKSVERLNSSEFNEYCKSLREDTSCDYYTNVREKNNGHLSVQGRIFIEEIEKKLMSSEKLKETCASKKLCPYEMASELAKKANVIVTDYYYVFHPTIRDTFFEKIGKGLEDCIIIIDEGHNLPSRLQELNTDKLSNFILKNAVTEARDNDYEVLESLVEIQDILNGYAQGLNVGDEKSVDKNDFLNKIKEYEKVHEDCEYYGSMLKTQKEKSFISSVGNFLQNWKGPDEGYARIFSIDQSKAGAFLNLHYKCLDPSLVSEEVLEQCHSSILMSGTLTPTEMYSELLGYPLGTIEKEYEDPFSEENKISLVVPTVTTKYTKRTQQEFKKISDILVTISKTVPGNTAVFFPSYSLRDQVYLFFKDASEKSIIIEKQGLSKEGKAAMLEEFKQFKNSGAVLLGVTSGSFGEGIDLPGDFLKCVVIVGIPLGRPNLETKELITYYNEKFGRGWDYGYILPAITKVLQNAGRCIRSETDRGVILYLDERYTWPNYAKCFPADSIELAKDYEERIKAFFA